MIKRIILFLVLFIGLVFAYRAVMGDVHTLTDDDIFICVDSARECKVYVVPETFKATGTRSFDITVKNFFYERFVVDEVKFSFWEDGGKIFYRADDGNPKEVTDDSAKAIWNYSLEQLQNVR